MQDLIEGLNNKQKEAVLQTEGIWEKKHYKNKLN